MLEGGWATRDKVQTPEVFTALTKRKEKIKLNILNIVQTYKAILFFN